jgi:hypothetical protein
VSKRRFHPLICALLALPLLAWAASQPWKGTAPQNWTARDIEQLLNDSPWSQSVGAIFALAGDDAPPPPELEIPQAGMPSPHNGSTDGHWDGGVSRVNRNGPPTLNVTVRWDSALPVRQALERQRVVLAYTPAQLRSSYIITVVGLVPAGRYRQPELNTRSGDGAVDSRNPEEMLEGVMRYSRLYPRGKQAILPEDAKLDNESGALHIFFKRTEALSLEAKEVTFETRFGSLSVLKRFRLKDMLYQGQLEL